MKYFKSKVVDQDGEILAFITPVKMNNEEIQHHFYARIGGYEYHGISDDAVLPEQHDECEVEEVAFADMEEILKESRLYKEINAQVEQRIRDQYSIGDEFSILKADKASPEYIAYQQVVDECRQAGRAQKIALGLKQ